jgi:hypothetical protein
MIRYIIRNKATGEMLGYRPSYGKRQWTKNMDKVAQFRRRCDVGNALNYLPEVKQWLSDNQRRHVPHSSWIPASFPVEVMEFTVVLIERSKGYITETELKEQLT